ncbi:DNA adenine modification methylase (plasmid) [Pseudomonas frederiksbergensis]|uniref:DNA adenine modification methylase n=1 Tax=Pseudomonas frederiksbergensis TaxID=104087 RepID=A0A1J0ETI1_9PSED|nr:DNA adenine modification methylase [Pseudomonas frederiksbergensis]APC19417.1 DNA adenine modification methylase [Pseudomonas frederiksbergensis]
MFNSSVVSFPDRGPWGKSNYRGNCTGHIVKGFVESYQRRKDGLVVDPSVGGGTSADVARDMGLRFFGTDLHQGFNLLVDDLKSHVGEEAHLAWWHPPYAGMLQYSGVEWGEANKWDMSRMCLPDFTEALELAVMNIHDAVERGGVYGILMGNLRKGGEYFNLSSLVERVSPGRLIDEVIKVQHNCVSDSREYRGRLIRIAHEKLLVFRKQQDALFFLATIEKRAEAMVSITWRAAVRRVLQGGKMLHLKEINAALEPYAQTRNNQHWAAKIRQVLQNEAFFERVKPGVYRLAS